MPFSHVFGCSSCLVLQAINVPVLIKDALILSKSCGKNSFHGRVKSLSSQYNIWPTQACQESINTQDALAINLFTDFIGRCREHYNRMNRFQRCMIKGSFCMEPYVWILKEKRKRS